MVKIKKWDRVFSEIIRSVGHCEKCFRESPTVQLQTAHIISRTYSKTRTDFRNAFCLCAEDHFYFTKNPLEFSRFVSDTWARDYYDEVRELAHDTSFKMNWEERHEFLLDAKTQLKAKETTLEELRDFDRTYY